LSYRSDRSLESLFLPGPLQRAAKRMTQRVGDDLAKRVAHHTPVAKPPPGVAVGEWLQSRHGRRPGHLKGSWKVGSVKALAGGTVYTVPVYTNDPVAPHVEYLTRPHEIQAKRGGVLRFPGKGGGWVFAKLVHHPGSIGAHMMATALVEIAATWTRIGAEEVERWSHEQLRGAA